MTWVFKPSIYVASLTEFPKPVTSLVLNDRWDMDIHKVPLNAGQFTEGRTKNGVSINISGFVGKQAGTTKLTEEAMFGVLESLRTTLDTVTSKFEFFVYHDTGTSTYRKFKDVVCQSFSCGLGDETRVPFSYSAELLAEDPVIYTTAPGA